MAIEVIGREQELASVEAFLERLEEGPSALILSGEPGIGKTILWEAGVEEAEQRFERVLVHRSVEAEASLSFTGLSDLLAPVFDDVAPSLAPLRRRALEIALLLAEPGEHAPDPRAIGLALLDALQLLAEQKPVVVALDDLQWLDASSAGVLQIALRRLRAERIGLLTTVRTTLDAAPPAELDRSFADERLERIPLGPLSLGALHHLLRARVGLELTRPELVRVQEASAGNPFFALELGRELVRTGSRPEAGKALPVPESLNELLGGRLARLPTDTGDVVLFAAALARPTVDLVVAAHGYRETVVDALETAAREGVVELDDSRLRFAHPLLASICYEQAPIWKRRAIHGALARAVSDVEERARHMALAAEGPDAVVASYLDAAAEQAAARGATGSAAELSELAAERTPDDPALVRQRLVQAANYHRLAGAGEQAAGLLRQLLTEVPPGAERADILLGLASIWGVGASGIPMAVALCDEALESAAGDDRRSARILGWRSLLHLTAGNAHAALADGRAALERAERVGDPALLAAVIALATRAELWAADVTPGLLERGAEIEERLALPLEYTDSPRLFVARHLMRMGEIERPRAIFDELEAAAAARGDESSRWHIMWYRCLLDWLDGHWQQALDEATVAYELHTIQGQFPLAFVGRVKALIEADLGLVEQARASAEEGLAFSNASSNEAFTITTLGVLGRLELALGNLEAAGDYLRDLPGRLLAGGLNDPAQPLWPDAIETLVALGELDQARAYLEAYELHTKRLGSALALEGARRCRGLLTAAEGDLESALAVLESAISENPEAPWPFERARTLLCLGVVRRQAQQKKASRETLMQALASFEELGARLWAEKARAELGRISGRRTSSDELTETEHRVAELAAHGRTNKEIASELFMGVSTVEAHLSRVYRKLGLRSRTELAGRITARDVAANLVDEGAQA